MKISLVLPAFVAGLILASGAGRAQSPPSPWEGDQLNVQILSPNPQTVLFDGFFTAPKLPPFTIYSNSTGQLDLGIFPYGIALGNFSSSSPMTIPDVSFIFKLTDRTAGRIVDARLGVVRVSPVPSLIWGNNFIQFDLKGATIGPAQSYVNVGLGLAKSPTPIPEPGTLLLLASGLLGLVALRRAKGWTGGWAGRQRSA
jgi:hypothetical protein